MTVYRICNAAYAYDLSGEGARLHGGRWNHIGTPCLYASSSRSLTVLEYSVNVNLSRILRNLVVATIEIPEDDMKVLSMAELPGDWKNAPAPASTKVLGTSLINAMHHLVIKIPSTVVPEEFNFLVNPRHHRVSECSVVDVKDFVYDLRIKTK